MHCKWDERRQKSAISSPVFAQKNRAAARWLYVVASDAGILGKAKYAVDVTTQTCTEKSPAGYNPESLSMLHTVLRRVQFGEGMFEHCFTYTLRVQQHM